MTAPLRRAESTAATASRCSSPAARSSAVCRGVATESAEPGTGRSTVVGSRRHRRAPRVPCGTATSISPTGSCSSAHPCRQAAVRPTAAATGPRLSSRARTRSAKSGCGPCSSTRCRGQGGSGVRDWTPGATRTSSPRRTARATVQVGSPAAVRSAVRASPWWWRATARKRSVTDMVLTVSDRSWVSPGHRRGCGGHARLRGTCGEPAHLDAPTSGSRPVTPPQRGRSDWCRRRGRTEVGAFGCAPSGGRPDEATSATRCAPSGGPPGQATRCGARAARCASVSAAGVLVAVVEHHQHRLRPGCRLPALAHREPEAERGAPDREDLHVDLERPEVDLAEVVDLDSRDDHAGRRTGRHPARRGSSARRGRSGAGSGRS